MSLLKKSLRRIKISNRPTTKGIRVDERWYKNSSTYTPYKGWFFGYNNDVSGDDYVYVIYKYSYTAPYYKTDFIVGEIIDDVDTELATFSFDERLYINYAIEFGAGAITISTDGGSELTNHGVPQSQAVAVTTSTDASVTDAGWLVGTTNSASTNSRCHESLWSEWNPFTLQASLTGTAEITRARPFGVTHTAAASLTGVASRSFVGDYQVSYLTVKNYRWYEPGGLESAGTALAAVNTPAALAPYTNYVLRLHLKNETGATFPFPYMDNYFYYGDTSNSSAFLTEIFDAPDTMYEAIRDTSTIAGSVTNWGQMVQLYPPTPFQESKILMGCTINGININLRRHSGFNVLDLHNDTSVSTWTTEMGNTACGIPMIALDTGECLIIDAKTHATDQLQYNITTGDGATMGTWTNLYADAHAFQFRPRSARLVRDPNGRIWLFFSNDATSTASIYYDFTDDEGSTWDNTNTNTISTTSTVNNIDEVRFHPSDGNIAIRFNATKFVFYNGTSWSSEQTITNPTSYTVPDRQFFMVVGDSAKLHIFRHNVANDADGDEETGVYYDYVVRRYEWTAAGGISYGGGASLVKRYEHYDIASGETYTRAGIQPIAQDGDSVEIIASFFGSAFHEEAQGYQKFIYDMSADTFKVGGFYRDTVSTRVDNIWAGEIQDLIVAPRVPGSRGLFVFGSRYGNNDNYRSAFLRDRGFAGDTVKHKVVALGTDGPNFRKDLQHQIYPDSTFFDLYDYTHGADNHYIEANPILNNQEFEVEIMFNTGPESDWTTTYRKEQIELRTGPLPHSELDIRTYARNPLEEFDLTDDNYIEANGSLPTHWTATSTGATNGVVVEAATISAYRLKGTVGLSPNYLGFSWTYTGSDLTGYSVMFMARRTTGSSSSNFTFTLYNETKATTLDTYTINFQSSARYYGIWLSDQSSANIVSNNDEIAIRISDANFGTDVFYIDRIVMSNFPYNTTDYVKQNSDDFTTKRFVALNFDTGTQPKAWLDIAMIDLDGEATVSATATLGTTDQLGEAAVTGVATVVAVGDYAGGTVTGLWNETGVATITPVATKGITDTLAASVTGVATIAGVGAVYRTQQTAFRWRNDDGTETTATWAAATNATISPQYANIYRIRFGIYAKSATQIPPSHLEYRVNGTGDWKPVGGYQTAMQVPADRWINEDTIALDSSDYATNGYYNIGANGKRFFHSNNGRWHIFYNAVPSGKTVEYLMHMYSDNDGTSWSTPSVITHTEWDGFNVEDGRKVADIAVAQQPDGDLIVAYAHYGHDVVAGLGTYEFRTLSFTKSVNNGNTWADSYEIDPSFSTSEAMGDLKWHVIGNDNWCLSGKGVGLTSQSPRAFPGFYWYDSVGDEWFHNPIDVSPSGETLDYMAGDCYLNSGDLSGVFIGYDNTNNGLDGNFPLCTVSINYLDTEFDDGTQDTPVLVDKTLTTNNPKQTYSYSCGGYLVRNDTCTVEPDACSWLVTQYNTLASTDGPPKYMYGFYGKDGWFATSAFQNDLVWVEHPTLNDTYFGYYGIHQSVCQGEDEHAIYKFHYDWYVGFGTEADGLVQYGLTKGVYPPTEIRTLEGTDSDPRIYAFAGEDLDGSCTIHWESTDSKYYKVNHDYQDTDIVLESLDTAAGCYLRGTNNFDPTTQQITTGTYQTSNKGMAMWGVAECRWHTIPADTYVEYEYYVQTAADGFGASDGDVVELRVYGIDDYVELPSITYVREKAALTGVATVVANGDTDGPKSSVSAVATLLAAGEVVIPGFAALQGVATLAGLSKMDREGATDATGTALLAPAGHVDREAIVSLSAQAVLESDALSVVKGAWSVSSAATLVIAEPAVEVSCRVSLVGVATASSSASADRSASASLTGVALMGLRSDLCLLPGHRIVFRPANELYVWRGSGLEVEFHPGQGQGQEHPGQGNEYHTGHDPTRWGRVVYRDTPDATIEKSGVPEVVIYRTTDEATV